MKKYLVAFLAIVVVGLAACPCAAGDIRESVLANASDYSYMWWANGLRDEAKVFNIQTSHYAMSFDYGRMQLTHLTPLTDAPEMSRALVMGNKAVFGKGNIALECALHAGGGQFRIAAPKRVDPSNCHLVESGRFFQRRYLTALDWGKGAPKASHLRCSGF